MDSELLASPFILRASYVWMAGVEQDFKKEEIQCVED